MDNVERLKKYIDESKNIVFFGGAGVSTESGIPDFRSKDGLYNQHDVKFEQYKPEYLLSKDCFNYEPKVFFEFYKQKMDTRKVEPNITHKYLANLEKSGKLKAVITQNIDGLHQKAGSKNVYEIHGTTSVCHCLRCNKEYDGNIIFDSSEKIPRCECGGILKPNVVLYGENLPNEAVYKSIDAIRKADMLIIAGTSLEVYPAASFITYFAGEHIVVINKEKINVMLSTDDDLFIEDSLGNVIKKLM